mmetsp:Transcript_101600/g.270199  ORF Transcript_101600/g.270199 Transcript_101600/m.270199 type:complete len:213 (+) Transcript_101600:92-730(+)
MEILCWNHERVQWTSKVGFAHFYGGAEGNSLVLSAQPCHTDHGCVRCGDALFPLGLYLHELLQSLSNRHEPRWFVDLLPAHEILLSLLFDLDVEEAQGVQPRLPVGEDLVIEAARAPVVGPEGYGNRLAEAVELQATRRDGVHDRGVVHHVDLNSSLPGPQHEVGVGGRAERIPHDEEAHLLRLRPLQHLIASALNELSVGLDDVGDAISIR